MLWEGVTPWQEISAKIHYWHLPYWKQWFQTAVPVYHQLMALDGSPAKHSFSGFKLTQILTVPELFGTTTIPAHQGVGSWTWEITPNWSIWLRSSFTLFLSGIGTLLGVKRAYGLAPSCSLIWYSLSVPSPVNKVGYLFLMIEVEVGKVVGMGMWSTLLISLRAMMDDNPSKLVLRWRMIYTSSGDAFWPVESVTLLPSPVCSCLCWSCTASIYRIKVFAFSKVRFGVSCNLSESACSACQQPIVAKGDHLSVLHSHVSISPYRAVIYCLAVFSACWWWQLNLTRQR